jgi:hypothetical protein
MRFHVAAAAELGLLASAFAASLLAGCARPDTPSRLPPRQAPAATPSPSADAALAPAASAASTGAGAEADASTDGAAVAALTEGGPPAQLDPDGNDDLADTGTGALPTAGQFERVGRPPLALQRICDLRVLNDALYAAHANQPLGTDGATITRYQPELPGLADTGPDAGGDAAHAHTRPSPAFRVAFDWNRPGEPAEGGGAGQGFLRIRRIGGRLFVPDSDPPHDGFGISEHGTEGFVFVSDPEGRFARATTPHFRPPPPPNPDGGAGAAVLPRAYHDLDVIRFRGRLYASTGAVPPHERAWRGPSPGALQVANDTWSRWTYEVDYPYPWKDGVWRLGYLVRFRDRLYAGIQDYDGREPNDYVVFDPPKESSAIDRKDVHAERVTQTGAALTLRWYADHGRLYWIALQRDGSGALRVTSDGDHWQLVSLPAEGGRPTDITRYRDGLVVLTERRLYRLSDDGSVTAIAELPGKHSPFELTDSFCSAPLAVYRNDLYAGGQRDGALYRLTSAPP